MCARKVNEHWYIGKEVSNKAETKITVNIVGR